MQKKSLSYICLLLTGIILAASCKKGLLDTYPKDKLSGATFWETREDAVNAVNAIYSFLPGNSELNWDMLSDIATTNSAAATTANIERGQTNANMDIFQDLWNDGYKAIRAANYLLENVDQVQERDPSLTDELRDRLKGEARFLRAYFYTRLVMLFGDVPLVTATLDVEEAATLTRTPKEEIWDFVDRELAEIAPHLPNSYTGDNIGRITKGAALALQARAMLYAGRWKRAADAAKAVMDLQVYDLYPQFEQLFTYGAENNQEVILDRQYAKDIASTEFFYNYGPRGMNGDVGICPTRTLVDAFETVNGRSIWDDPDYNPLNPYAGRDPRLGYTVFIPAFSDAVPGDVLYNGRAYDPRPGSGTADEVEVDYRRTKTGYGIRKYINIEDLNDPRNCGTNFILIRYADVLLMYAEAKTELNELDATVYDALNKVRQRSDVNLPPVTAPQTQGQMREIVRHERMVELALEGLRLFDLRRWKAADEVMQGAIPGMTYIRHGESEVDTLLYNGVVRFFDPQRDYLFPIPQQEVLMNSHLTQNPNY